MSKTLMRLQIEQAIDFARMDAHELVDILGITVEQIIRKFGKELMENAGKFGVERPLEEEAGGWEEVVEEGTPEAEAEEQEMD